MTEIPEHLLKRAQAAREKAAAESSDSGAAASADEPATDPRIPAHLLERSKARASGAAADTGGAVAVAERPAAPAAGLPVAAGPGGHTQRLLTVVKSGSIQDVKAAPVDKVHTWPHLLAAEFVAALACTAFTFFFSVFVNAPLLQQANINKTIIAHVPMKAGLPQETGDFDLDGVTFPAAEVGAVTSRCPSGKRSPRVPARRPHRHLGRHTDRRSQDRRPRGAHQPLGHDPRHRPQRRPRPLPFRRHRAVRHRGLRRHVAQGARRRPGCRLRLVAATSVFRGRIAFRTRSALERAIPGRSQRHLVGRLGGAHQGFLVLFRWRHGLLA
mgnify:CR=1 FL=1